MFSGGSASLREIVFDCPLVTGFNQSCLSQWLTGACVANGPLSPRPLLQTAPGPGSQRTNHLPAGISLAAAGEGLLFDLEVASTFAPPLIVGLGRHVERRKTQFPVKLISPGDRCLLRGRRRATISSGPGDESVRGIAPWPPGEPRWQGLRCGLVGG